MNRFATERENSLKNVVSYFSYARIYFFRRIFSHFEEFYSANKSFLEYFHFCSKKLKGRILATRCHYVPWYYSALSTRNIVLPNKKEIRENIENFFHKLKKTVILLTIYKLTPSILISSGNNTQWEIKWMQFFKHYLIAQTTINIFKPKFYKQ